MARIYIRGLAAVRADLGPGVAPILSGATQGVGEEVRKEIARYPGPVKHPIQWKSERQRRAVMAKRRDLGPYKRQTDPMSQRLGPSWAVAKRGRFGAVVGTRVTYAPFVQKAREQQPFHRNTGWVTDEQAAQKVVESGVIEDIFERAFREHFK